MNGRTVAIYDGDCGFCTRWRDRMIARDPGHRVEWLSVHDPSVTARYPGLDREDALRQMWVIEPNGTIHKGAEGWRALFRRLEGLGWLEGLYRIPGGSFVIDRMYRFIAARRHRLSCRTASCRMPGAAPSAQPPTAPRGGAGTGRGAAAVVAALFIASSTWGCGEETPDPVTERLQAIADPEAARVVQSMFEAYGPYAVWKAHRNVEYTYRLQFLGGGATAQATARQMHRFDLGPGGRSFAQDLEGPTPQIVRVEGERIEVKRNGTMVSDPAQLGFPRAFMRVARFTFLLPWNLLDEEMRLSYRAARTPPMAGRVPAGECDVIRLTFEEKDPSRRDDWHDIYVSRVNHLIDRVHSYRGEDRSYLVSIWSDHRTFDGVRVSTHRETHQSDVAGTVGPTEAVVDYTDVRFDAPFGDEVWAGMIGVLPPSAGEAPPASGRLVIPDATPAPDSATR